MRELSVERMQLSADPDDWCWVRWYWTLPGARPLPFTHAFGFSLWENRDPDPVDSPQIVFPSGKWRGNVDSEYPGTDFLGQKSWWQDGLPMSARQPGDAGRTCEAMLWDGQVFIDAPTPDFPGVPAIEIRGGAVGGGRMGFGVACRLFYGACIKAAGGALGGGACLFGHGQAVEMDGGAIGGGACSLAIGQVISLAGGAVGGGKMSIGRAAATFIASAVANVTSATLTVSIPYPAGGQPGDLVLVAAYSDSITHVPGTATGFTNLGGAANAGSLRSYRIGYRVLDGTEGASSSWGTSFAANLAGQALLYRYTGTPTLGTIGGGFSTTITIPGVATPVAGVVLNTVYASGTTVNAYAFPIGMTVRADNSPQAVRVLTYDLSVIAGFGPTATVATTGSAVHWLGAQIFVPSL